MRKNFITNSLVIVTVANCLLISARILDASKSSTTTTLRTKRAYSKRTILTPQSSTEDFSTFTLPCKTLNQQQPNTSIVFGIRCDEGVAGANNELVIKANERIELMLFGQQLYNIKSVALTTNEMSPNEDCTDSDRISSMYTPEWSGNMARVVVRAPATSERRPYFLCVLQYNTPKWIHQGNYTWLSVHVQEDLLPIYMKILLVACLLMLSGLFSGLNLGLMALDKNELQVIISCGTDTEKRYARAIEPVRSRGNYLLCSILFSNVLINSTIAVLLEELTSGLVAVMTSTIFIVMFGEILPQAFCSRHGLAVGAKTVLITYFCMLITFPLSWPVSACLDWALGEEIGHAYDRERLMEFIRVTRDYNNLETDEVNIISGALKLKRIPVVDVMTRIEDVYSLELNANLDFNTVRSIIERGYSRVPIHEPGNKKNIVALLFTKDLALLDPDKQTPVQTLINFYNHPIIFMFEDTTLNLALDEFKTGKSHMAFVRRVIDDGDLDPVYEITGLVTLEDVIEEIMQMEINDETDTVSDNRRKRRRKEAQVGRTSNSSLTTTLSCQITGSSPYDALATQLRMAAYQFLATSVEPFASGGSASDATLRHLLGQNIYHTVHKHTSDPNERRLYTANVRADYFIMILEGRVQVVCGHERLLFEGGPFSYFGKSILMTSVAQVSSASDKTTTNNIKRVSVNSISSTRRSKVTNHLESVNDDVDDDDTSDGCGYFVPDYSVDILTDFTSYLKVSRQDYLAAIRATQAELVDSSDTRNSNTKKANENETKTNLKSFVLELNEQPASDLATEEIATETTSFV